MGVSDVQVQPADMKCREWIKSELEEYAKDENVIFLGYNTLKGSRMYGTLSGIPENQCIETPVAENLMMGMAIGMALEGLKPVVCFERHDFLLLALDALINHADKLPYISGDQFKLPIVVRAIVGGEHPLNPGPQHTQNYASAIYSMLKHTQLRTPDTKSSYRSALSLCGRTESGMVVIIEKKDWYELTSEEIDPLIT